MAPVLRQIYDQMMEPKWVISMGVCASSGGMFNNYAIVQGVDQIVPVDVYAPGCPPGPQTLMHAILTLHANIRAGELTRRPGEGAGLVIEQRDGQTATGVRIGRQSPAAVGTALSMTDASVPEGADEVAAEQSPEPDLRARRARLVVPRPARAAPVARAARRAGARRCTTTAT